MENITLKLADSEELLDKVFSIRYQAYLTEGYIDPNPKERFSDDYDYSENAKSFIVLVDKKPAGSIRAISKHPEKGDLLPLDKVYSNETATIYEKQTPVIESCKFTILPEYKTIGKKLSFPLFKGIYWAAANNSATDILTAIRANHKVFYEKLMKFNCISDIKNYPGLKFNTVLMHIDVEKIKAIGKKLNPRLYKYFFEDSVPWEES